MIAAKERMLTEIFGHQKMWPFNILYSHAPKQMVKIIENHYDGIPTYPVGNKVEDIRSVIDLANKGVPELVLIIEDGDNLTTQATNALLKLTEEPPKGVTIFMIVSTTVLPTISSRANSITHTPYTQEELTQYVENEHEVDYKELTKMVVNLAETPDDVDELMGVDVMALTRMVDKMLGNVKKVSLVNFMKIAFSINTKKEHVKDMYDFNYLLTGIQNTWKEVAKIDDLEEMSQYLELLLKIKNTKHQLRMSGTNITMLVDNFLVGMWEVFNV